MYLLFLSSCAMAGQPTLPKSALQFPDFIQSRSRGIFREGPNPPDISQPVPSEYIDLFKQLDPVDGDSVFYVRSGFWPLTNATDPGQRYSSETMIEMKKAIFVGAKVPCPAHNCILFGPAMRTWLVTTDKEGNTVDFELIVMLETQLGKLPNVAGQVALTSSMLDTTFNVGTGMNNFAKDGVFCTSFLHEDKENRKNSYSIQYKRRVLPNGKLEHKKIDHWKECLTPW